MAVGSRDYYDILGVSRDASAEDVRAAHRRLARKYHPDVSKEADADDRFKELSEAYEVLRDPEKRERYDRLGQNWRAGDQAPGGADFEEFFRRRGGGGAGSGRTRGGPGGGSTDVGDLGDGDFGDIFEGLFGGRAGSRRAGFDGYSMRGGDQEATLELSLEEAARGGSRRITFADGREFNVTIPAGVRDGQRIRLAGEGSTGVGGGPAGDLVLRVRIRKHPRFRLEGKDLYVDLPVAPWEAALGASVDVDTLDGTAKVRVPAGSSSGRRLRLRGQGFPASDGPGDLYAVVKIVVPKTLSDEERELFERLAQVSRFNPRGRR